MLSIFEVQMVFFLRLPKKCIWQTKHSKYIMVLNTIQQLLHNQDDKNHKTEYVITYISSTAYNLHDLYNL